MDFFLSTEILQGISSNSVMSNVHHQLLTIMDLIMINKEQLMAFIKFETLPNEMRFDLFNANRICHQPEIPFIGSFKTCRF